MIHDSLQSFLKSAKASPVKGPVGVILLEDEVEVDSTVRHHLDRGFKTLIVVGSPDIALDDKLAGQVVRIHHDMKADDALTDVMNGIIGVTSGSWVYYCYNSEYLFHPFCESRSVGEMVSFCMEERRYSVLSYIVDLYANDLEQHPDAVSLDHAHLDKTGYYALGRKIGHDQFAERQLDFFGGLRWRFEEHVPTPRRRIDRAKALKRNPGSTKQIPSFMWHNSAPFSWHSQQLMDFGLMEPGQWF